MPPKPKPFLPPPNWRALYKAAKVYTAELVPPSELAPYNKLFCRSVPAEERRLRRLVMLMLSAQTRAEANQKAMNRLLKEGSLTPERLCAMPVAKLRECIRGCSYHNRKAAYLKQVAVILLKDYGGKVPKRFDEVLAFPGVGPKMAHLYFQAAEGEVHGIGVDTHVHRISQRFRWVPSTVKSPEDTRKALEAWLPKRYWQEVNVMLVGLGQKVCRPRNPLCGTCKLNKLCPNAFTETERLRRKAVLRTGGDRTKSPRRRRKDEAHKGATAAPIIV